MKVTLLTGRAHMKHTEGGDFRQATYRALRQGLMQAESQLLEPYYGFTLELPSENLGRAMADMDRMFGTFEPPVTTEDGVLLTGKAPVACLRDYQREVIAYTKGRGHLSLWFKDYEPCHNAEEVIEQPVMIRRQIWKIQPTPFSAPTEPDIWCMVPGEGIYACGKSAGEAGAASKWGE